MKKSKQQLRKSRVFSEAFKRQRVSDITQRLVSISEVSKLYGVSRQSVYRWLHRYSEYHQKGVVQVVQMESEAHKTKALLAQVAELERKLGQKQLKIDYLEKLVEISSTELKVDLKKNFGTSFLPSFMSSTDQKDTK